MKIAISGASGFVGTAIGRSRSAAGDLILPMTRDPGSAEDSGSVYWSPAGGSIDAAGLEGLDAAIHLAGENLAAGRWSQPKKQAIRESRVRGTRLLAETLAGLKAPPRVFLSASAIGYYGDRGDEWLTEEAASGQGFLAEVCRDWEEATESAARAGIRVVRMRFGVILDPRGGMLARLLPIFRCGLGGRAGDGRQFISWIALSDLLRAIGFLLGRDDLEGAVNLCSPNPVRNAELAGALGKVLRRPAFWPVPSPLLKLAAGKMAEEMILSSARATPRRLSAAGFLFEHPELEPALQQMMRRDL